MKACIAIPLCLALSACAAPEIADWPPEAPAVSEQTIQRYVDIYGGEPASPTYGPDDVDALILLSRKRLDSDPSDPEIDGLKQRLNELHMQMKSEKAPSAMGRSKNEINALKKRIAKTEDSPARQRIILRSKYGVKE